MPEIPSPPLLLEVETAAPNPSGSLKFPPLLSEIVSVEGVRTVTMVEGPAAKLTDGGKPPSYTPPGCPAL